MKILKMKNRVSELKLPLDETNGRLNNEKKNH